MTLRCRDELAGSSQPARKAWRTLVRVHDVSPGGDCCHVVVPAWNPHHAVKLCFSDVPHRIRQNMRPGTRLHAQVNIGAGSFEDLHFDEWEPE